MKSQLRLRRERMLPEPGDVVVSPGQEVSPVQVVARTHRPTRFRIVPASELWHISPDEVVEYLQVSEGTAVQQGDVLLQKKQLLGKKTLESPIEGTFFGVNHGRLIFQQYEWFELRALVNARVVNAIPKRGIVLEIVGTQIQGVWGSGKEGYGRLKMRATAETNPLLKDEISDVEGAIVVAAVVNNLDILRHLQQEGASGLIVGSLTANVHTKAASIGLPIIITDGVGTQGMARSVFDLLRDHEGHDVALFARKPDYWGNRPEIIISHDAAGGASDTPGAYHPPVVGQRVRILRAPYQSQVGEIIHLYQHLRGTELGMKAHGADVKLADGSVIFVPYANLDTIV
ncbi:MAG: hypothetical protein KC415_15110 [Anaerolineales bacterium]|nr:hypothetical protein [Anaerolineales bacterium]MCB8990570.1 hypothetical protein [Ardenticatenaceae bacterium]